MEDNSSIEDMSIIENSNKQRTGLSDEEYFSSYEDIEIHRLLVSDVPRMTAYKTAILDNCHLFKGKTVMDVGAGTGILTLFAAAAGAARVYAIEASKTARLVERVAADNGYSSVVTVLNMTVEEVRLPQDELVDVIISEWMGFFLLHESMLGSVLHARDHFLKEDGTMFPSEARLYACPCSVPRLYEEQLDFWDNVHGFNMAAVRDAALEEKMKKPEVCIVRPEELLAEPACLKTINLRWMEKEEVESFSETTFVNIIRSGTYDGICVWFECSFEGRDYSEEGEEIGKLVSLSTSPFSEPTHWKQTVVLLGKVGDEYDNLLKSGNNDDVGETNVHTNTTIPEINAPELSHSNVKQSPTFMASSYSEDISSSNNNLPLSTLNSATTSRSICSSRATRDVEEHEIVGWRLDFSQSRDSSRHYTITLETLHPAVDEHPEPCQCHMPRCLIIAKLIENKFEGKSFIGGG